MTINEIQDLIKLVNRLNLAEFKLKDGEFEVLIRTKWYGGKPTREVSGHQLPAVIPVTPASPVPAAVPASTEAATGGEKPAEAPAEKSGDANLIEVKSPIVGTFYRASAPDKPPYVKVGDVIEVGSVVCIVEAMKLFNEIESEVAGKIVKVMIEDASPVEYDQVLFLVDPKG